MPSLFPFSGRQLHSSTRAKSNFFYTNFAMSVASSSLLDLGLASKITFIKHVNSTRTNFADNVTNQEVKAQLAASRDRFAMPPEAIARAVAYAIEQPADVDVAEIIVRSTAQA
jgi:NADP-dependent 3-hydroxy acid dehydrogenase YdfG